MIDFDKVGRRTKLMLKLDIGDTGITLDPAGAERLAPTDGMQLYLTITSGPQVEIVLVTSTTGNTFTVVRAQDGTLEQNFPAGACVEAAWNKAQMAAFIQSLVSPQNCGGFTGTAFPGDTLKFQNGICASRIAGSSC